LKPKAFIIEKFLDTAFRRPIRFRQKVLMVFSELRWNYSPLKEKAVLLPDGLFVIMVASRQTATIFFFDAESNLLLMRAARRSSRPRDFFFLTKFVAQLFQRHRFPRSNLKNSFPGKCASGT
jgi:hypothetical protein